MSLPDYLWEQLEEHIRKGTLDLLDDNLSEDNVSLHNDLDIKHKGFYVGIIKEPYSFFMDDGINTRVGFLDENSKNILDSADICIGELYKKLKDGVLDKKVFEQSRMFLTVVHDVVYTKNPLEWNENNDGVFGQYGEYRGLYLPYEIARMGTKIEILDHLFCSEMGIPSLWKIPEGLIFKLICSSYPE